VLTALRQALGVKGAMPLKEEEEEKDEEEQTEGEEEEQRRLEARLARAQALQSSMPILQGQAPALLFWGEEEAEEGGLGLLAASAAWDAAFLPAAPTMRACAQPSAPSNDGGGWGTGERRTGLGPLGPALLLGACVHPQDRPGFFRSLTLALFGGPREQQRLSGGTEVVKVCVCVCMCVCVYICVCAQGRGGWGVREVGCVCVRLRVGR
jgi:hypothetical protein